LQRLPLARRWTLAEALAAHAEDAADANLPLMLWYGMEPLAPADPDRASKLLARVRIPLVRRYLVRRLTLLDESGKAKTNSLELLTRVLDESPAAASQRDILRGMHEALRGRRHVAAPEAWPAVYRKRAAAKDAQVRERALVLAVLLGDPQALAALRKTVVDPKADPAARRRALQTLVEKRAQGLLPLLRQLLADRTL